eukprot:CAMPEP_0204118738 /NCGR_PEP_ID=MMETSP0361-20130328/6716_1 /ASSEMBLY_ACC=CAM_ASM_000343 /TAXON_ID=268821 /ORGANISM="Scrippsiella Hangoei, Strain SHTV-5" /LENGTH=60 /DNA_ID=CAMNT_0051069797 /DNA_START=214 /DNA_END=393 /DNA_ORIENTATION=+
MKEAGSSKKSVRSSPWPLRPNKCFAAGEASKILTSFNKMSTYKFTPACESAAPTVELEDS